MNPFIMGIIVSLIVGLNLWVGNYAIAGVIFTFWVIMLLTIIAEK